MHHGERAHIRDFTEDELRSQREEFDELLGDEPLLDDGQTWYLIATRWYNQWEEFCAGQQTHALNSAGPHPGPIDNSPILAPDGALTTYARERMDFVIRSEAIWKKLHALYGGGPEIARKVVSNGWAKSVETHPYKLFFLKSSDPTTVVTAHFSKAAKIKEVRNTMCEKMGLNVDDVRMWDYHNSRFWRIRCARWPRSAFWTSRSCCLRSAKN